MPYLTVTDLRMYYLAQGSGPTVVLLHGLGSCADDWALQFPALSESYEILAPDLRGHGRTEKPPGPYSIRQMADDVAALMGGLNVGAAHVVGLSLGGLVAQELAVAHPERVRSLVLVNTFARLRPRRLGDWQRFLSRGLALLTGGLEAQADVVARGLFPRPGQQELRRAAAERLRANDPLAYRAAMRAAWRFDSRPILGRVGVPTLVVAGAEDTTVHLRAKEELATRIPRAQLEVVPDSGHATPVGQHERFNRLVAEFLAGVGGRS